MNDASAAPRALGLFEAVGVEIEYAIVDQGDLSVRPIADRVLRDERGAPADEVEHGALAWSNELVRHVIELKTNGPAPRLAPLGAIFAAGVREVDARLAPENARLLPTAMHPWMDPARRPVSRLPVRSLQPATNETIGDGKGVRAPRRSASQSGSDEELR